MEEHHGAEICTWKYEPPYNIYGWLPWEQMKGLGVEFGDPEIRRQQYAALLDDGGMLCGFAQFFPLEGVTRLGIGMKPELCGHGRGAAFVAAIVQEALRRKPENEVDLEVLTWNSRAIRAYQRAGFTITDLYERQTPDGMMPFYCMVYQPGGDGEADGPEREPSTEGP
ncbi:acetyltransferase [Paenibacillus yonginensis]|uniref:Acetyltransferase n=1 Tax=Paenibacillus yonginensis TaxID=1462996 RepID=A0A1B1N7G0_9BACL|nr:GNAT family N-acetyltransferase [Paenibacillus yonginensis]ANS77325.1 acetyltransferase [Paenibacillus yonginensis]